MNTCKYCGCTEDHACPGRCYWIDRAKTVCSECVSRLTFDELGRAAALLPSDRPMMALELSALAIAQLHGLLQLCLRHPGIIEFKTVAEFADGLSGILEKAVIGDAVLSEMLRRGRNPAFDVRPEHPQSLVRL